jgi:uncharacterized protein
VSERKTPPEGVRGTAAGTTDRSMPEAQSGSSALPREALKIASGYSFTGPASIRARCCGRRLSAGRAGQDPADDAQPARARQDQDAPAHRRAAVGPGGSGLPCRHQVRNEKVQARAAEVHQTWAAATGRPAEFYALGGIVSGRCCCPRCSSSTGPRSSRGDPTARSRVPDGPRKVARAVAGHADRA